MTERVVVCEVGPRDGLQMAHGMMATEAKIGWIAAMAAELRKLGAVVDEGGDWLRVTPPANWREATIDTYDDHRIAMCFALAAAAGLPVHIREPRCVAKTFPDYFERLATLTAPGVRRTRE